MKKSQLRVQIIGRTEFIPPDTPYVAWGDEEPGAGDLIEFSGRACYESWDRPNPKTATNEGYLQHIKEVGHFSVLEHAVFSSYITGVSRSLTHELVRHRHFGYSQLSQRYAKPKEAAAVTPPLIQELWDEPSGVWANNGHGPAYELSIGELFEQQIDAAFEVYGKLDLALEKALAKRPPSTGKKKQIRQAARSVLPNATETRIVVTGNCRAWRHFFHLRATEAADVEIRAAAVELLKELQSQLPAVFEDFEFIKLEDGTEAARSPFREEPA